MTLKKDWQYFFTNFIELWKEEIIRYRFVGILEKIMDPLKTYRKNKIYNTWNSRKFTFLAEKSQTKFGFLFEKPDVIT